MLNIIVDLLSELRTKSTGKIFFLLEHSGNFNFLQKKRKDLVFFFFTKAFKARKLKSLSEYSERIVFIFWKRNKSWAAVTLTQPTLRSLLASPRAGRRSQRGLSWLNFRRWANHSETQQRKFRSATLTQLIESRLSRVLIVAVKRDHFEFFFFCWTSKSKLKSSFFSGEYFSF